MTFTIPIELKDYVVIRATGEQAQVIGIQYQHGGIDDTFYVDCFSIYTTKGIFALQELAKVTQKMGADNYIDDHSV
jgi:hypothetical protein